MRRAWLTLLLTGCRYLAPAQPTLNPARPLPNPSERQVPLTANRCGVACAPGFHCDQPTATCVADEAAPTSSDAGVPWLP
ncbi:MAG: hypothetical protein IAE78_08415 [Myxococcus sp.]|nr:hypothetical protein [Myxococcus sp.]